MWLSDVLSPFHVSLPVTLLTGCLNSSFLSEADMVAVEEPGMISSCVGRVRSADHWSTSEKRVSNDNKLLQVVEIMTQLAA